MNILSETRILDLYPKRDDEQPRPFREGGGGGEEVIANDASRTPPATAMIYKRFSRLHY